MLVLRWETLLLAGAIVAAIGACESDVVRSDDDDDGSAAVGVTTTSTGGPAGTGGSATSTGVGANGAGGAGGTTPCDNSQCTYPNANYGVDIGFTLPPTLNWQGLAAGSTLESTLAVDDYFDCDGSCGINEILFVTTQYGSGPDDQAATWVGNNIASLQAQGRRVVFLLLDDPNEGPPSIAGAQQWKTMYGLNAVAVAIDPTFSLVPGGSVGTPMTTYVDPRTMTVTNIVEGFGGQL